MKRIVVTSLLLSTLAIGARHATGWLRGAARDETQRPDVLWPVPPFSYLDQHRRIVTREDLRGHVWIADFIFTQCTTACPLLTAQMMMLQRRIPQPDVEFVSFSVDPAHDTPEVLDAYAKKWSPPGARWRLLATTPGALAATVAGMHVTLAQTGDPADPIIHSDRLLLVDGEGRVRGVYDSTVPAELSELVAAVARLRPPSPPLPTAVASGEELFVRLGCRGCHDRREVAPPLGGLFGSDVLLSDETHVVADETYLRDSIVRPLDKTVAGYLATMPSYAGQLDDTELAALVAYVRALPATAATAPRQLAIDPVCKMQISAGDDVPHVEHEGRRVYFCCEACRAQFVANPAAYPLSSSPSVR